MDPQTFSSLKSQIDKPFFSDKKDALQTFLKNYWFSGDQAAEVIGAFPHASEKTEVLGLIEPRLTVLTGAEAKKVVEAFTFADGKLKAVKVVANHINDPAGKYSVLDAIDFHFDKEKARKILDEATPPPAPCQPQYGSQCPPAAGQPCYGQPPTQGYPGQAYQPPPQAAPYQPPPGAPYQQPPPGAPYQPPPGAPYQQPPPGAPYQPPPGVPYQQPPPGARYQQPPPAGYPTQTPYGAPPTSQYPPGVNPTYPGPGGMPPPNTGYPSAGSSYGYPPL